MVDDYMLDKVLDKIKEIIAIEKFDNTKILIEQMINYQMILLLKILWLLITCVIKDDWQLYPQICLEEALLVA